MDRRQKGTTLNFLTFLESLFFLNIKREWNKKKKKTVTAGQSNLVSKLYGPDEENAICPRRWNCSLQALFQNKTYPDKYLKFFSPPHHFLRGWYTGCWRDRHSPAPAIMWEGGKSRRGEMVYRVEQRGRSAHIGVRKSRDAETRRGETDECTDNWTALGDLYTHISNVMRTDKTEVNIQERKNRLEVRSWRRAGPTNRALKTVPWRSSSSSSVSHTSHRPFWWSFKLN